MAEAGIGSREGKGPALREGPAECHSMSLPTCTDVSPPGTEIPRKCSRCPILLSTWHGIPAKACQVSLPAFYLARYSRESVPGVPSRCPPATVFPQKRVRYLIPLPTWHGIPAKVFQVASPRLPPGTEFLRKCSRCPFLPPTCHGSSSHHGMLVFFSRACGCFQHEACNHQHTCSCGIHASF